MGDALAFCQPLIITKAQVDTFFEVVERSLDAAAAEIRG